LLYFYSDLNNKHWPLQDTLLLLTFEPGVAFKPSTTATIWKKVCRSYKCEETVIAAWKQTWQCARGSLSLSHSLWKKGLISVF